MYLFIAIVFVIGYLAIALEHPLHVNKSVPALLIGVICWALLITNGETILAAHAAEHAADAHHYIGHQLMEHLSEIASILFFLLGAMTIVELIDAYGGFSVITNLIKTTRKVSLLWFISIITFFLSAVLDNLTTAIVMTALLRKLIKDQEDLWFFAGMVVIAANAGGAWSPIGDVTTIMLWIGGQITAGNIILKVFLPSVAALLVPLLLASRILKGEAERPEKIETLGGHHGTTVPTFMQNTVLILGVGALLFVPIFKNITHLPPFMGILLGLGVLWGVTERFNAGKTYSLNDLSVSAIITRVDVPSVLFFLGILLAVAALQTAGHLGEIAHYLDSTFGNIYTVNVLIGLLSSVVDNVPLVAGAMGMYSMETYAQDHPFWELLAYCAGTGGSALIIGSAAGVAVMGILKIDFVWYLRKITWLALAGYFAGVIVYYFTVG